MNQNHWVSSQFTMLELMSISKSDWEQIHQNLLVMNFTKVDASTPTTSASIEVDNNNKDALSQISEEPPCDANEIAYCLSIYGQWCERNRNTIKGKPGCKALLNNLRLFAEVFNLIPAPHHCPPPPLTCSCLHQDKAPPCSHPHTEDALPPPPCLHPHRNDEDIPMEPPAPTCAFSEAASQTPAPFLEVSHPPPAPAAAASTPPAGPCGHASYTGTAAKNLNPAAPLFVHGPPHAPAAPPAQA
ncbi:hypothetical protein P691DRAFT_783264 [Macrolepiota fuliginosa MF-IS2]|uniref:Uncharacterized protein n=1 Tax=Macrolepiota fuliginosa MF-IS2 TaxID=1400762 RepID=A0A9P5WYA6_9AGAR|nr:hypothetical protein P691DRAFT_783264 [Macrolepiota fuliginosa MF-IS2]